jgi:hypothetical protein
MGSLFFILDCRLRIDIVNGWMQTPEVSSYGTSGVFVSIGRFRLNLILKANQTVQLQI